MLDGVRVRQIVSNLVSNALKFTTEGEVVVNVDASVLDDRGPLRIGRSRHRTGHPRRPTAAAVRGVSATGGNESTVRLQGAGLGLWIARELATAHGGELLVCSREGEGSTFTFAIDVERAEATNRMSSDVLLGALDVMVIEPSAASRHALETIATRAGFKLRVVEDIAGALESAAEGRPHVGRASTRPPIRHRARRASRSARCSPTSAPASPSRSAHFIRGANESDVDGAGAVTLVPYRAMRFTALLEDVVTDDVPDETDAPPPATQALRCLVVDDDATNRLVARLMLQRSGHRVVEANGGRRALEILQGERFDVLFLDLHMPEMDGAQLAEAIRTRLDPRKRLWLIALTAAATEEDRQRCLDAGMDDFVTKPIEIGLLHAALERARRGARRRGRTSMSVSIGVEEDTLQRLFQDLEEDAPLLIEEYLQSSGTLIETMRRALEEENRKEAHRAAHTLASSSALVGAATLADMAREAELNLKNEEKSLPTTAVVEALDRMRKLVSRRLKGELERRA